MAIEDNPISLDTADTSVPNQISLDTGLPGQTLPSMATAQDRAYKANYALGDVLQADYSDIYNRIASGQEDQLRKEASTNLDYKNYQTKQALMVDLANRKGSPLDSNEVNAILDPGQSFNKPVNPDSVIEKAYGQKWATAPFDADQRLGGTVLAQAQDQIPAALDKTVQLTSNLAAKNEYLLKLRQDAADTIQGQSTVGYLADIAKGFVPFYNSLKERGLVQGVGFFDGMGQAENLDQQAFKLYSLPFDQFKSQVDTIYSGLKKDNPGLADSWLHDMMGQSTDEKFLNNLYTVFDLSVIPGAAKLGLGVARQVSLMNKTRQAFKDLARNNGQQVQQVMRAQAPSALEGPTPQAPKAAMATGSGDVPEAAAQQATSNLVNTMSGQSDPRRAAADSIANTFRTGIDNIESDPGSLSRDAVNRLEQQYAATGNNLVTTVQEMARVQRIPIEQATEEQLKIMQDNAKGKLRGIENNIYEMTGPHLDEISNTLYHEAHIIDNDSKQFKTPEQAKSFSDINGLVIGRDETTVRQLANEHFGRESSRLDVAIKDLEDRIKEPPAIDEDTAGLNYHAGLPDKLAELQRQKEDLHSWHAEKLTGQDITVPATEGFRIKQRGLGYEIVGSVRSDENENVFRNLLNTSINQPKTNGFFGKSIFSIASWVRSPEDTASAFQSQQRKVATYAQARLRALYDYEAQYINDLKNGRTRTYANGEKVNFIKRESRVWWGFLTRENKGRWEDLNKVWKYNQSEPDPATGLPGRTYNGVGELEDAYLRINQRMPDTEEISAYFAKKRIDEIDHQLRNIGVFRNKARLGAATHRFFTTNPEGQRVYSPFFDGTVLREMPGGNDTILVLGSQPGDEKIHATNTVFQNRKLLEEAVKEGRIKIVKVYDPETRPFQGYGSIGDQRIRYVATDKFETKPLTWDQVPKRGGGHWDYNYEHYIKQAKIRREVIGKTTTHWYEGDSTFMPVAIRAMGEDIVKKLEVARVHMHEGRLAEAKDFVEKNLPISWDEWKGYFETSRDTEGRVQPPRLSTEEPFRVVPKDVSIAQIDNALEARYTKVSPEGSKVTTTFKDGTREGSDARQFQVRYTGARDSYDMFTFKDEGTQNNPVYSHQPAELVDPTTVLNRGISRAINSFLMDDMKITGIESWMRAAAPHLDAKGGEAALRSSPFYYFNKPVWKSGTPIDVKSRLAADRYKLRQLIGIPDYIDTFIHSMAQNLEDWRWERYGANGLKSKIALTPAWMLDRIKDPVSFIRGATYHIKLGLFSLPQLIVQNMTYVTIMGITPRYGTSGILGAFLHGMGRLNKNPEIINALDKIASTLHMPGLPRWRPGEFKEAFAEMEKTGFGHVGGEYIGLDDMSKYNVVKNGGKQVLDWGQGFFRMGERNVRRGAWYTAFKEWRDVNPTTPIGIAERNAILDRADLLNTNMSRASASTLHSGVFSLTSQFLSYQLRLTELMWGQRLAPTLAERTLIRARVYMAYAGMFGATGALGVTGLPIGDYLRQWALKDGYQVGEKWSTSLVNEGIPAALLALITGGTDSQKGNWYNVNDRYGVSGWQPIKEALNGDTKFWTMLGGASTSSLYNAYLDSNGFYTAVVESAKSFVTGQPNMFPPKVEDFVDMFKEVQSVNQFWAAWVAIHTGRWMTKNEGYISDVSAWNAAFMFGTGLKPQEQDDVYPVKLNEESEKDLQKWALGEYVKNMHRAFDAVNNRDYKQADQYFLRANTRLEGSDYPTERRGAAMALANKGFQTLIEQSKWDYYMRNVPDSQKDLRLKAYQTYQEMKNKRETQ